MNKKATFALLMSHIAAVGAGFAVRIHALPIPIAPPAPGSAMVAQLEKRSDFVGAISRKRKDSDAFHWGDARTSEGRFLREL